MMRKQNLAAIALAVSVSTIAATPAIADTIDPVFTAGDLILGVQSSAATATVLEINVGAPIIFKNADLTDTNVFVGNINADLTSLFGSNWYDDSSLFFGVSGASNNSSTSAGVANANNDFNSTVYASRARLGNGTTGSANSTAWSLTAANVTGAASPMVQQANTFNNFDVDGKAQIATTNVNDWKDFNPVSGTNQSTAYTQFSGGIQYRFDAASFVDGTFGGLTNVEGVIDLYRLARFSNTTGDYSPVTPGQGIYIGSFAITQTGDVHFITAVPEPSSAILLGLTALAGFYVRRRQALIA